MLPRRRNRVAPRRMAINTSANVRLLPNALVTTGSSLLALTAPTHKFVALRTPRSLTSIAMMVRGTPALVSTLVEVVVGTGCQASVVEAVALSAVSLTPSISAIDARSVQVATKTKDAALGPLPHAAMAMASYIRIFAVVIIKLNVALPTRLSTATSASHLVTILVLASIRSVIPTRARSPIASSVATPAVAPQLSVVALLVLTKFTSASRAPLMATPAENV